MSVRHFTIDLGQSSQWQTATVCLSNSLDRAALFIDEALTTALANPIHLTATQLAFWVVDDTLVYDLVLANSDRQTRVLDIANLTSIPFHEYPATWEDAERTWDWSFVFTGYHLTPTKAALHVLGKYPFMGVPLFPETADIVLAGYTPSVASVFTGYHLTPTKAALHVLGNIPPWTVTSRKGALQYATARPRVVAAFGRQCVEAVPFTTRPPARRTSSQPSTCTDAEVQQAPRQWQRPTYLG